ARRPGAVTAAAVFAFIAAVLQILAGLFILFFVVRGRAAIFGPPGLGWGYVAVDFGLAVCMVWGGIAALRGRRNRILVYTALVLAAMQIVQTVLTVIKHYGSPFLTIFGLVLAL